MEKLQSAAGIFALLAAAWLLSENRRAVPWRRIALGVGATFALAVLFLIVPPMRALFAAIAGGVDAIAAATRAGTSFVFGYVGGAPLPFES
jgi:CNT family concentrative nucleoside transporter